MVSASDNLLLAAPAGVGIPVAQACVDYGVKDSLAFASSPYPGESVIAAPGLLSGSTGQELPGYPAYAASRYPAKEQDEVTEPGYTLRASSDETSSAAAARSGVAADDTDSGSTLATAEVSVDPAAGTAEATAHADTQPLTINDVLRIGQVRSVASVKLGDDGAVERSSRLRLGRTTVAGQEVVITADGVEAAGQTVALPDEAPADALQSAGVSVRYLAPVETQHGVISAGIEITATHTDASSGAVYTAQYTLGRAFAAASAVDAGAAAPRDDIGELPAAGPPPATEADGESTYASAAGGGGGADVGGVAPGDAVPDTAPGPDSDNAVPSVASDDATSLAANPIPMGIAGLYLVIVFGALAMVASGTLLRLLGVRTRWTS